MDSELRKLMEKLRQRCGVYIGGKFLEKLIPYVYGYIDCMYMRDGVEPDFLPRFQEFVETHYNLQDSDFSFHHWTDMISFASTTEEEAFDKFYELMDLYLETEKD